MAFTLGIARAVQISSAADKPIAPSSETTPFFKEVTNIVFKTSITGDEVGQGKWKHFNVSDPKELRRLLPAGQLETKGMTSCKHRYGAEFQSATGSVSVSFCHICFDVKDVEGPEGRETQHYRMPKEFYAEFQKLARRNHWPAEP